MVHSTNTKVHVLVLVYTFNGILLCYNLQDGWHLDLYFNHLYVTCTCFLHTNNIHASANARKV